MRLTIPTTLCQRAEHAQTCLWCCRQNHGQRKLISSSRKSSREELVGGPARKKISYPIALVGEQGTSLLEDLSVSFLLGDAGSEGGGVGVHLMKT